jgi:hypothetical protein
MSQSIKRIAIGCVFALVAIPVLAQPPQGGRGDGGGRGQGGQTQTQPQVQTQVQVQSQYQPPGPPQSNELMTVYSRGLFAGQSVTFNGPNERVSPNVVFNSIQVRGAWQLCAGPNYSGACVTVDRDSPVFQLLGLRTVGSLRPLRGNGNPGPMPPAPPPERGDNPNLRGANATFYPRPAERGLRVQVGDDNRYDGRGDGRGNGRGYGRPDFNRPAPAPSEQEVRAEAAKFCRTAGFGQVRNADAEQINRRYYLTDVLCTKN